MCHCLSKTGIGSTDEMTSTWLCQIYHMAVSLAIKKNWQETIAVAKQRSWFSISEPDCANFDSFCTFETRWLAQVRCSGVLQDQAPEDQVCWPADPPVLASTRVHTRARTHANSTLGLCILSKKGMGSVLILEEEPSVPLSAHNPRLMLYLLFWALLLGSTGAKESKFFFGFVFFLLLLLSL